ncbi:MAG: hypothetical protein AB8G11_17460 [Saprospiraceae bacterium]
MLHRKTTYQSPVFTDFETLGRRNYHEIVRFCEQNRSVMEQLNFDEFFIMELAYCNALFQMDMFDKLIKTANHVIELSILNNIQFYEGEDIYHRTLFQKAQAHKLLNQLPEAIHITKELIKMKPISKEYQQFLKMCHTKSETPFLQNLRGYGVLICLISAGLLILNILIIEPFFPMKVDLFNMISVSGLIIGGLSLIGGLSIHHWKAKRKFDGFMKSLKQ